MVDVWRGAWLRAPPGAAERALGMSPEPVHAGGRPRSTVVKLAA
jgi:hypothetical protein